eukprot:CAMPEP_0171713428 /NCGR_PEP_ID=MMETSP0991-20121206/17723_1 /TAXON_ID=483369 /ORGANISM="non described non described, Strain CCMP2098" /LENGTH=139 /DNA_ID=CAMNT_0012304035 /DNA_START=203 /DNA_END=619 /DNA_ORIENTATION=+
MSIEGAAPNCLRSNLSNNVVSCRRISLFWGTRDKGVAFRIAIVVAVASFASFNSYYITIKIASRNSCATPIKGFGGHRLCGHQSMSQQGFYQPRLSQRLDKKEIETGLLEVLHVILHRVSRQAQNLPSEPKLAPQVPHR